MAKITCEKCGRTKQDTHFYTYKDGRKTQMCKDCLTMHINIWQPDTFLWLLQKMDVPYVPEEWNILRDKAYAKNPAKKNDVAVFGKYLSKMKLKQWKDKTWADSEELQREYQLQDQIKQRDKQIQDNFIKQQFEKGEITQAQYRTLIQSDIQRQQDIISGYASPAADPVGAANFYNENNFMAEDEIPDLSKDLTDEDRKYLVMKWGRYYTPQEWVQLQTFYKEMSDSFTIKDADTRAALILICKNNLKMNQALDQGDLQGYQKLAKVSDTLRKSAKFTAAQNKEQRSEFIDSVGQLVAYCQKHGGQIPKFEQKFDLDIIDTVIKDLKEYTKTLIYEDTALARQIEDYLKKREYIQEQKKDLAQAKARGLSNVQITDEDIQAYNQEIQSQKDQDNDFIEGTDNE